MTLYKIANGQIVNRAETALDNGTWLPVVIVDRPACDPATQKETPSFNILADRVEVTYVVSPNAPDFPSIDMATLNAALAEPGSVVRGLALVLLDRINAIDAAINALNTKTSLAGNNLPQFTQQQLANAIQAKMR